MWGRICPGTRLAATTKTQPRIAASWIADIVAAVEASGMVSARVTAKRVRPVPSRLGIAAQCVLAAVDVPFGIFRFTETSMMGPYP